MGGREGGLISESATEVTSWTPSSTDRHAADRLGGGEVRLHHRGRRHGRARFKNAAALLTSLSIHLNARRAPLNPDFFRHTLNWRSNTLGYVRRTNFRRDMFHPDAMLGGERFSTVTERHRAPHFNHPSPLFTIVKIVGSFLVID